MTAIIQETTRESATRMALRQAGNPFRNYFARNPDDEYCARFHVPELFALQRAQLLGLVELFRATPGMHSEIIPVLGNKGAGKTHLLHSIKHGGETTWQLLVTPGTYQRDTDFLEYLLFQVIDTLLGGGKQKGQRPLAVVSETLVRGLIRRALEAAGKDELLDLFPAPGLGRWTRRFGLGTAQAQERTQWLLEQLNLPAPASGFEPLRRLCAESNIDPDKACELVCRHIERMEPRDASGMMRRHILEGFVRFALLGDESDLANFLTYGFAELEFKVRPSRQDLVLALFKVLMSVFQQLHVPVVVAFDQLEDLLLARRNDDGQRTAEAFFAGIVQIMHQIDGLCFLVFAERGLWNRFVPSLDGYIQDRLNNPVHVPGHGTIKVLRLEAPPAEQVRQVVETRLQSALTDAPDKELLPPLYPFTEEQVTQIARTEPTLRDMLQQFRQLFDGLVFGNVQKTAYDVEASPIPAPLPPTRATSDGAVIRSVVVVESPPTPSAMTPPRAALPSSALDTWRQEILTARARLEPEGALTGATRELQAGLGAFLQTCHEHGVKVGPWRLQHVVPEWSFGEHPTYGMISIAHWACRDGQPWKVGVGLFLGRGNGKSKDLEIKLAALDATPAVVDHLILLRPEDDLVLSGKSKTLWQDAEKRGRNARLEPVALDAFAVLYGFPRWLTTLGEGLPQGQTLPNLADLIQDQCEKMLEQVCMPICP